MTASILTLLLAAAQAAPLRVVTTTTDLASVAREVAGDKAVVEAIASPSSNPHFVDAKPSYVLKLMKADVFVETGLDLEAGWAPLLVQGARNAKLLRVEAAEAVEPIEVPSDPTRATGDVHPGGNPHFMVDPRNAAKVAKLLAERLGRKSPGDAALFEANARAFAERVESSLPGWLEKAGKLKGASYVSYHKDWNYLARLIGLKQTGQLEPKPGIPPTPSHTAKLIADMKAQGTTLIITDPWYEARTPQSVAAATGARLLELPLFPRPKEGYFDWMDRLFEELSK